MLDIKIKSAHVGPCLARYTQPRYAFGKASCVTSPSKGSKGSKVSARKWTKIPQMFVELVVEPTHLKNMFVKMGSSSPGIGVKICELPPPSCVRDRLPDRCFPFTSEKENEAATPLGGFLRRTRELPRIT